MTIERGGKVHSIASNTHAIAAAIAAIAIEGQWLCRKCLADMRSTCVHS
jgi:hypothetical protein